MLAPRKTLWSTPDPVLEAVVASSWIEEFQANDVVCDIGCGDGRVLIQWASSSSQHSLPITFVGLEIDEHRAQEARENVQRAYASGRIPRHVKVTVHCANAVQATHLYKDATVFFLYLIPRGLRLMYPILKQIVTEQQARDTKRQIFLKVITYMTPLPKNETYVAKEECRVDHQPGAAWPLYLYHLYPDAKQETDGRTMTP
jgi:hypothetical protein